MKNPSAVPTDSFDTIRNDFPFLHDLTYFNRASCSPCPEPVAEAMMDFYRNYPINYRSGSTPTERNVTARVDEIRAHIARFIGAPSSDEIVFTKNTTEAINIVANGWWPWQPGDEIALTPIEHQSNLVPWIDLENRKKKGSYFATSNRLRAARFGPTRSKN